jgi:hypothetical protein
MFARGLLAAVVGAVAVMLAPMRARAQTVPPDLVASLRDLVGSRIEGSVILAGDQGLSGGTFSQGAVSTERRTANVKVTKFGGVGDVGHRKPVGELPIRWQWRVQGSIGYLKATNQINAGMLQGDTVADQSFAAQFGGGLRFWFDDHWGLAPTLMGMYGHTHSDYTARSAFAQANLAAFRELGIVDWTADTWTVIPAVDLRYVFSWHRALFKISSDFAYYYTQSFKSSNVALNVQGSSETWRNQVDADIPLGIELFNHELHTGGIFSRTELYGDIKDAFVADHMYRANVRVVLDFVGKLWNLKWIGVGGSYIWGSNFNAYTLGVDVALKM